MALLGAVKAQTWSHAEDTVPVTESLCRDRFSPSSRKTGQHSLSASFYLLGCLAGVQPEHVRAVVLFSEEK